MGERFLRTREELEVFMHPQRQRIMRELEVNGAPMTPKAIADALGVSASTVTFHLKKLESIGLAEVDHTEKVRGVTARFYRLAPDVVRIGSEDDDLRDERAALVEYHHMRVWEGFRNASLSEDGKAKGRAQIVEGVAHLSDEDARELGEMIRSFVSRRSKPRAGTEPWEFSFLVFPHGRA